VPSPDVSSYIDLTLFDLDSQQIYLNALEYARIALPEYQPVDGSIETVLLQAMALEVQDLVRAINRLPNGIVQALLGLLGAPRFDGTRSTALAKFTASSSAADNETIPAGIRLFHREDALADPTIAATDTAVVLSRQHALASLIWDGLPANVVVANTANYHGLSVEQIVSIDGPDIGSLTLAAIETISPGVTGVLPAGQVQVLEVISPTSFSYLADLTSIAIPAETITFTTTENLFTVDSTVDPYGYVYVTSVSGGEQYVASGTEMTSLTAIPRVASVVLATDLDGGSEAESDTTYFTRASSILGRMTSALVTTRQIAQYIASDPEFSYAYRVNAIDNCSSSRTLNQAGQVLVVMAKLGATNDLQIDSTALTAVEDGLSDLVHPALTVNADNAFLATVNVSVTVAANANVAEAAVRTGIDNALQAYLSADTWDWSQTIRRNEIMTVVRNATYEGFPLVAYVDDVTIAPVSGNFSTVTLKQVSTFTRAATGTNVLITTASAHGLTIDNTQTTYVALALTAGGYGLYSITGTGPTASTQFYVTAASGVIAASGNWAPICYRHDGLGESGDVEFFDPAPLVRSGTHSITII